MLLKKGLSVCALITPLEDNLRHSSEDMARSSLLVKLLIDPPISIMDNRGADLNSIPMDNRGADLNSIPEAYFSAGDDKLSMTSDVTLGKRKLGLNFSVKDTPFKFNCSQFMADCINTSKH